MAGAGDGGGVERAPLRDANARGALDASDGGSIEHLMICNLDAAQFARCWARAADHKGMQ